MTTPVEEQTVTIELEPSEALVLDAWLYRTDEPQNLDTLTPFEQAALGVRWDLKCLLEKQLVEPFAPNYDDRLQAAVDHIRQKRFDRE